MLPVAKLHNLAPVLAFRAYTLLSMAPTYTTPFAIVGPALKEPPVVKLHNSAPVLAFKAYTLPPVEAAYTAPFATTGGEYVGFPSAKLQCRSIEPTVEGLKVFS